LAELDLPEVQAFHLEQAVVTEAEVPRMVLGHRVVVDL
jgi:hypothetical protein